MLRVSGAPGGKGSFAVPSVSTPGLTWTVELVPPDLCWCPCPKFGRTNDCRHAEAARDAFVTEARAHQAARRADPAGREEHTRRLKEIEEVFSR